MPREKTPGPELNLGPGLTCLKPERSLLRSGYTSHLPLIYLACLETLLPIWLSLTQLWLLLRQPINPLLWSTFLELLITGLVSSL